MGWLDEYATPVGDIKATPEANPIMAGLAKGLKSADEFVRKPFGYDNPPATMLSDFLGVPALQRTMERVGYGEPLTTGKGMTAQIRPDTVDAALAVAPMLGPLAKATKGLPVGAAIKINGKWLNQSDLEARLGMAQKAEEIERVGTAYIQSLPQDVRKILKDNYTKPVNSLFKDQPEAVQALDEAFYNAPELPKGTLLYRGEAKEGPLKAEAQLTPKEPFSLYLPTSLNKERASQFADLARDEGSLNAIYPINQRQFLYPHPVGNEHEVLLPRRGVLSSTSPPKGVEAAYTYDSNLAGGGLAAGASSAKDKLGDPMADKENSWLGKYAEPAANFEYDVSEYAPPADETTAQRIGRLGKKYQKSGTLENIAGVGEAALQAVTGAGASALGGIVGGTEALARMPFQGTEKALREGAQTSQAIQRGGTYEPRTTAGQLIGALSAAPFELASEYGGKALGAAGSLVGPKTEAAMRTIGEAAPQVVPAVLGGAGVMRAAKAPKTPLPPATPTQAAAIAAQEAGYVLPPSQAKPTILNRFITGYGGKLLTDQAAALKNQPVTNSLAKKALGIPEASEISVDTLNAVRAEAGKAYQAIKDSKEPIYSNEAYTKRIQELSKDWQAAERDFPEIRASKTDISALQKMMDKPEVSPTGAIEMVKHLRSESKTNMKAFDDPAKQALGKAQRQAAEALDKLVEDNLRDNPIVAKSMPNAVEDYRKARQLIAKSYDVETALTPSGDVNALVLARMLKDQKLTGHLKDIAEMAAFFKKNVQLPTTIGTHPGISPLDVAVGGIEATGAMAAGKPGLAAAALGTVAGRPLARTIGLSEAYQKGPGRAQQFDLSADKAARKRAALLGGAAGASAPVGEEVTQ